MQTSAEPYLEMLVAAVTYCDKESQPRTALCIELLIYCSDSQLDDDIAAPQT
jgi:hypothetical protein